MANKFPVKVLAVKYKNEILQVDGIKDTTDVILFSFEDAVIDAVKEDEETLKALTEKFQYVVDTSYLGETEIYHFVGTYGNLTIYTSMVEVEIKE